MKAKESRNPKRNKLWFVSIFQKKGQNIGLKVEENVVSIFRCNFLTVWLQSCNITNEWVKPVHLWEANKHNLCQGKEKH